MADRIQQMVTQPTPGEQTAYEAIGLPLTLVGTLARTAGIPLGTPLALLGGGLTALGVHGASRESELAREKALAGIVQNAPAMGPNASQDQRKVLAQLLGVPGEKASDALAISRDLFPTVKPAKEDVFMQYFHSLPKGTSMLDARKQWEAAGHAPPAPKSLSGYELEAAGEMNLPTDPAKLSPAQWTAISRRATALRLAGEKAPVINMRTAGVGIDASGNEVPLEVNPRTGAYSVGKLPPGIKLPVKPKPTPKPPASGNPLTNVSNARKQATEDWDDLPYEKRGSLSTLWGNLGAAKQKFIDAQTKAHLNAAGLDAGGRPLKPGDKITLPDGSTAIWR